MKTSFFSVLKNQEFLKIWLAQLISVLTANMLNFILLGKIFETTGSSIALGLLWLFYVFPTVILGPFSGVILDYLDKKKILFYSSFVQAFVVLLYLGVGNRIWLIYGILLIYSFCDEFFTPTIAVLVPSLVKKKELAAANGLLLFTVNCSIVLGFLVGGLALKFLGHSERLFMVASFALLLSSVLAIILNWREPKVKNLPKVNFANLVSELVEGYSFIKNEPMVLFPMIMLTGLQVIIGMGLILLPAISKSILFIDFADASYMILIPTVLGAVGGGLLVERIIGKYLKRTLIINGLFLMGGTIFLTGVLIPFLWPQAVFGGALTLLIGGAYVLMFIPLQVLVQENTPFRVRGRVFGTLNTLITIAAVIPVLATTTLIDLLGVKLVLALTGTGIFLLAFYARKAKYAKLLLTDKK